MTPEFMAALRAANQKRQVEWTGAADNVPLPFRAVELAGEAGEAANVCKKLHREKVGWPGSRATPEQLAEELADVVICADLLAMDRGINIEAPDSVYRDTPLLVLAVKLGGNVGHVLEQVEAMYWGSTAGRDREIELTLRKVVKVAYSMAVHQQIVLQEAVRNKFNATSVKVGLQTVL